MNRYRLNYLLLFGVYGFSFIYILSRHYQNILAGGHRYLQGDWLINFADGPVRRGFSGEFFLALGESLNQSPLFLLGIVQAILLALFVGALLQIAWSKGLTDSLTLVLLSPALVLFWVNDQHTPFRKELLGYLIFVPLFLMRSGPVSNMRLTATTILLTIAVTFQEANAVFFIPLALVLWLLLKRNQALGWVTLNGLITLAATGFALLHMSVPSVDKMCARASDVGAGPDICKGGIAWLSKDFGQVVEGGWKLVAISGGAQNYILAIIFVTCLFGSVAIVLKGFIHGRETIVILTVGIASITPLYFVAGDWGRWLSIQMFVVLFLLLAVAEKRAWPEIGGALPVVPYTLVLAFNLSVGVFRLVPTPEPGFIRTFAKAVSDLLT